MEAMKSPHKWYNVKRRAEIEQNHLTVLTMCECTVKYIHKRYVVKTHKQTNKNKQLQSVLTADLSGVSGQANICGERLLPLWGQWFEVAVWLPTCPSHRPSGLSEMLLQKPSNSPSPQLKTTLNTALEV